MIVCFQSSNNIEFGSLTENRSLPKSQKFVHIIGMHIACGEQHELTIQTKSGDPQLYVVLSHNGKIEQRIPGAQKEVLS